MSEKKDFIKNSALSVGGFGILIISNFVFNAIAGRKLTVAEWGIFNSFFYFILAFSQPLNAFQLAVAKYSVKHDYSLKDGMKAFSRVLFLLPLGTALVFAAFAPFLTSVFHLPTVWHFILGALVLGVWISQAGFRGLFQGNMLFSLYGADLGFEGLLRMGAGFLLFNLGFKVAGALSASVLSSFLSIMTMIAIVFLFGSKFNTRQRTGPAPRPKGFLRELLSAVMLLLPFGLILSMDTTMVQHVVGGNTAGYLTACAIFGKNLIVLVMVFANVVFSYVLKNKSDILVPAVLLTAGAFVIGALLMIPIAPWLIGLVPGPDFLPAARILPLYLLVMMPLAVMQHLVNFALAKDISFLNGLMWILLLILIPLSYFVLKNTSLNVYLLTLFAVFLSADILFIILIKRKNIPKTID